jgi:sugar phosphate isomerase/epimerase
MRPDQLAVQLYTVRDLAARDLAGTLGAVSAAGFAAVELAGLPPTPVEELRDLLAGVGLAPMASHEPIEALRADLDGVLRWMQTLGCPRIVVPWLPEVDRATPDAARRVTRELSGIAATCADHGVGLGYHNHDFEFAPLDGTTLWAILLDELAPEVAIELDVYWATIGGRDPVEAMAEAGDRLALLHMKDMAAGPERRDVAPGDGVLPWTDIAAAGTRLGVEWYVVEEDNPRDAIDEIARGRAYLAALAEGG